MTKIIDIITNIGIHVLNTLRTYIGWGQNTSIGAFVRISITRIWIVKNN